MIRGMATRDRPLDRANRTASAMVAAAAEELRRARTNGGLSQRDVAQAAGVSHATVSRIERAASPEASLIVLARLASVVGLKPSLRFYPDGDPIRDMAHARLLERLHGRLHPDLRWRTEVPLLVPRDLRAWDATIIGVGFGVGVEAETRLRDLQAAARRTNLKKRDGELDHVILLVADTRANRLALRLGAADLGTAFPASQRDCLRALSEGRDPGGSAIIVL
jgi:transcriptional regulator with XRE-family HTH domain